MRFNAKILFLLKKFQKGGKMGSLIKKRRKKMRKHKYKKNGKKMKARKR